MNRHTLIADLTTAPHRIYEAESQLLSAICAQHAAKDRLADAEAALYVSGQIDGKNAEIRAAQLREHTLPLQCTLRDAETARRRCEATLAYERDTFEALRAIAALLGPDQSLCVQVERWKHVHESRNDLVLKYLIATTPPVVLHIGTTPEEALAKLAAHFAPPTAPDLESVGEIGPE